LVGTLDQLAEASGIFMPRLITEITRPAMATEFAIAIPGAMREDMEVAIDALDDLGRLERLLSIYVQESQVSEINRQAGIRAVVVDPDVFSVISRAKLISEFTSGAFDVTAGPLLRCWGFTNRRGRKPSESEIKRAKDLVGFENLIIDKDRSEVYLPKPLMEINLGAIGKGYALDLIASKLRLAGITNFLIHGGRSSVLAYGSSEEDPESGWEIAIEDPIRVGIRIGLLKLINQGLSTSGSGKQYFHFKGTRMGHIVDPRTGYPAGDMHAITVLCPNATDADALSTACFIDGQKKTEMRIQSSALPADKDTTLLNNWPSAALAVTLGPENDRITISPMGQVDRIKWRPIVQ
jgi:thiamine biosynthesis lipoprotein